MTDPRNGLSPEELKAVTKEAIKEFLETEKSKFQQQIGKAAINLFFAALVGALTYLIVWVEFRRHN